MDHIRGALERRSDIPMPQGTGSKRDLGRIRKLGLRRVVGVKIVSATVAHLAQRLPHLVQGALCRTGGIHNLGEGLVSLSSALVVR